MKTKNARVKAIATIGPQSKSLAVIRGLVNAGVSGLRINLSHTPLEEAVEIMKQIRKASKKVALIIDTQGKERRISSPDPHEPIILKKGEAVVITSQEKKTTQKSDDRAEYQTLTISTPGALTFLKKGDIVTLDDNVIKLQIEDPRPKKPHGSLARVVRGGIVQYPKNIKVAKGFEPKEMLTKRDREVIRAAHTYGLAEVSLSYVGSAGDVREARQFVREMTRDKVIITSKIETRNAVQNIEGILRASDAILVDRNDLGTEIGYEKIALVQKFLVKKAQEEKKPVYVATHLLESMITKEKPTRGEVNDIINLVLDGVSALILSSETALGKDPIRILKTLKKLIEQGEFVFRNEHEDGVINRLRELGYV